MSKTRKINFFAAFVVTMLMACVPQKSVKKSGESEQMTAEASKNKLLAEVDSFLSNASFEKETSDKIALVDSWYSCDFRGESPADVQPGNFGVTLKAFKGKKCIGMVTRSTGAYEAVCSRLLKPLRPDSVYQFEVYACLSPRYASGVRPLKLKKKGEIEQQNTQLYSFAKPVVLQVWGCGDMCDPVELLGVTPAVANFAWQLYQIKIRPQTNYKHLMLQAYYDYKENAVPYNGHILIDALSIKTDERKIFELKN